MSQLDAWEIVGFQDTVVERVKTFQQSTIHKNRVESSHSR